MGHPNVVDRAFQTVRQDVLEGTLEGWQEDRGTEFEGVGILTTFE